MHIGYYSPGWPPESNANGVVTYVAQMCRNMRARGHTVTIFSPTPGEGAVHVQAGNYTIGRRIRRKCEVAAGLFDSFATDLVDTIKAVHSRNPIDVFEIEESFGFAEHIRKGLPFPVVTRLHGPHFLVQTEKNSGIKAFRDRMRIRREGEAIRVARAISSMSPSLLEKIFRYYEFRHPNSHVIFNPIETCSPERRWRVADSDPNLLLFVGRFSAVKGGDTALQAFSILADKFPDLRLIFAGVDTGLKVADGSTMHIEQYIATHVPEFARDRISYVGRKNAEELEKLRRQARAVIISSLFEMFPYGLLELLALGVPSVSTAYLAATEHIVQGESGLVAPIDDVPALAHRLEEVLLNPDLASRIGQGGWQLCQDKFSPEKICRETEALYQSLLPCKSA